MARQINTVTEVYNVLRDDAGGSLNLAAKYAVKRNAVLMWKVRQQFPAETYVAMTRDLTRLGFRAPHSLWGQKEIVT